MIYVGKYSTLGLLVLRHLLHAALVDFITFVFTVISYKRASFDQMKYFIENWLQNVIQISSKLFVLLSHLFRCTIAPCNFCQVRQSVKMIWRKKGRLSFNFIVKSWFHGIFVESSLFEFFKKKFREIEY